MLLQLQYIFYDISYKFSSPQTIMEIVKLVRILPCILYGHVPIPKTPRRLHNFTNSLANKFIKLCCIQPIVLFMSYCKTCIPFTCGFVKSNQKFHNYSKPLFIISPAVLVLYRSQLGIYHSPKNPFASQNCTHALPL